MPYTVPFSFNLFRSSLVDLDPEQVNTARKSREYLKEQIETVAAEEQYFPKLYGGYVAFGSFARKTKVRPLDDIDLLLLIGAGKGSSTRYLSFNTYTIVVPDTACPTWICTNDDNETLNSRKVLNKIKNSLSKVENYKKADIKYTGEAVTLGLKSYDWNFDIVPAVPVSDGNGGIGHYLIPDGNGNWKRTDPRRDQKAITSVNQYHNEHLIPLIRTIKYWNVRYYNVPRISSYYLETMLINGFKSYWPLTGIRVSIRTAFDILHTSVLNSCPDPKGLGDNLDDAEEYDDRLKVWNVTSTMATYAENAVAAEQRDDHKTAIEWWQKIFPGFPAYG